MRKKYDTAVMYKFIICKIKGIVCDNRGRLRYIDSFDSVIYDIFGINHLARKINESYDNRDIIAAIDRVGIELLSELMSSRRMADVLKEIVQVDYRINEIRKDLKKQAKKGKTRDKYLVKEYNYLVSLKKDSIKFIRRKLGIKNSKTAYKRRYRALNDISKRYDDDDEFTSIFLREDDFMSDWDIDDSYGEYEYDEYDDDDYRDTSELDDFVTMMNGPKKRDRRYERQYQQRPSRPSRFDDIDIDDWDDESESRKRYPTSSDDDDEYEEDRIDALADAIADLSSTVQSLLSKEEYLQNRRNVTQQRSRAVEDMPSSEAPSDTSIMTDYIQKLHDDVIEMKKGQKIIAKVLDQTVQNQKEMSDNFDMLFEEEDDMEVVMNPPVMEEDSEIDKMKNLHPDIYSDIDVEDVEGMTREELIDQINKSSDLTTDTNQDNKVENPNQQEVNTTK